MRFFNTAGPVRCEEHYCLPPLQRFDLDQILSLIDQKKYFVLHAPRQTGKTSSLLALKERIILRRETHIDQLVDKLREERVRSVIEPILAGQVQPRRLAEDDVQYVEDLGLITTRGQLRIANKLYQEVIPRALTYTTQLTISHEPSWYIWENGRLDMDKLLAAREDLSRDADHGVGNVRR
jgi:hypothetical protein